MAFRNFTDAAGRDWQVFDVVPLRNERRGYDRRAEHEPESDDDRRDGDDRRVTVGGTPALGGGVSGGWLCFENAQGGERRRLSPIPDQWMQLSDAELDALRETARPVKTVPLDSKNNRGAAVNPRR